MLRNRKYTFFTLTPENTSKKLEKHPFIFVIYCLLLQKNNQKLDNNGNIYARS